MERGHGGVVIGSDMSGDVRNVFVHDCDFSGPDRGIRLKSTRGRGGVVEDIWVQDIKMSHIDQEAVRIHTGYRAWFGSDTGAAPLFRNIHFKNITCDGAKYATMIVGLPEKHIEGVTFENVSIKAKEGMICNYANGIDLKNVTIVPEVGPVLQFENVSDSTIRDCRSPEGIETYLEVKGEKSEGIRLESCDLSQARKAVSLQEGASQESVIRE
jgi:polygalacturonase